MTMLHETYSYLQRKLQFFKDIEVFDQILNFKEDCEGRNAKTGRKEINLGEIFGLTVKLNMFYASPEMKAKRKGRK